METLISLLLMISCFIAGVFVRTFFPSYFGEKGKNLATKEDITEITRKVQSVRHEYNSLVEELKARHQLRMAALDRRLQAHQEAFTHWRKLISNDPDDAILACQTWWEKNCLYLEPNVRQAFVVAFTNEHARSQFVKIGADSKLISDAWDKVMAFPNIVFEAIQLPPHCQKPSQKHSTGNFRTIARETEAHRRSIS
jgi:hypothetical protein